MTEPTTSARHAPRPSDLAVRPGPAARQVTGAQALILALEELGTEVVFGLPGGAILPAYDPLLDSSMRHILVRHEQGAGHMAEGYAHVTGQPGVAMVRRAIAIDRSTKIRVTPVTEMVQIRVYRRIPDEPKANFHGDSGEQDVCECARERHLPGTREIDAAALAITVIDAGTFP